MSASLNPLLQQFVGTYRRNRLPIKQRQLGGSSPCGKRWSTKPDPAWVEGRFVPRNCVLVAAHIHLWWARMRMSDAGRDGRIVNLTSSSTSSPLAPLIATGLRLRSTWTMWQSVPPVTMLYLFSCWKLSLSLVILKLNQPSNFTQV